MLHWRTLGLGILLLPAIAAAQGTPAGTVCGYVFDPDRRAVADVRVVVENPTTGETRNTSTNQQGFYSVPALPPGPYNITIEANGFKTVHQNGMVLEADQQARLDLNLRLEARPRA